MIEPLLAAESNASGALIVFLVYMAGVFAIAAFSHQVLSKKKFLSEYFLGSRSLGVWAFALTFAATSASGGSFVGFPAKVYSHGWVVALWIGSYMVVPILVMGLLGKRINQLSRKTGAITIPDLMRDRFESPVLGGMATFLLVFFMTFNLIAQFKAGSIILQSLLQDEPLYQSAAMWTGSIVRHVPYFSGTESPGYLLCLLTFAIGVIVYTSYGGFRAVVWTDVMQGVVMVGGVIVMLPLAIYFSGGLTNTTEEMAEMTPPNHVTIEVRANNADSEPRIVPFGSWLRTKTADGADGLVRIESNIEIPADSTTVTAATAAASANGGSISAVEITVASQIETIEPIEGFVAEVVDRTPYAFGAGEKNVYVTGPGPSESYELGFLPLSLAVSFFFMWTFSGAGQPGNMVRQMAFKGSKTLRYGILTLCIYFSLIYFPLVLIFCCARVLLPGWEIYPDRIMPEIAKELTSRAGYPWVAGLLVAAPFAAVMSTVDSFLLISSSAIVRDIYQRNISPNASEKTIKRMTYSVTFAIGTAAMVAAVNPPDYLQDIIIFTGSGLSTSFLAPIALMLYWPRFTKPAAMASMAAGFFSYVVLYGWGYFTFNKMQAIQPGNFHPFMIALLSSLVVAVIVTYVTPAPVERLTRKFFYKE